MLPVLFCINSIDKDVARCERQMPVATLSSKFQLGIPKAARENRVYLLGSNPSLLQKVPGYAGSLLIWWLSIPVVGSSG